MRTTNNLLLLLLFTFNGCSNNGKQLTKDEALTVLKKEYPRAVDTYIYAGDPKYAVKLKDAGLDRDGYVVIKQRKKFGDSTGWITFTEKSQPYFLETTAEDKKDLVQRVKAASEDVIGITGIDQNNDDNTATVTYQTKFTEITPFGKLVKLNEEPQTLKAYFTHDKNGWQWEKRKTK